MAANPPQLDPAAVRRIGTGGRARRPLASFSEAVQRVLGRNASSNQRTRSESRRGRPESIRLHPSEQRIGGGKPVRPRGVKNGSKQEPADLSS
jgi:hypothetical protein